MEFDPARPIWHQLIHEFSRRIVTGEWSPGGRIGGVRELAGELGVNPNTVQRALSELERDGLCRSERTAGRFVTDDTPASIGSGARSPPVPPTTSSSVPRDSAFRWRTRPPW
ncbi:GntR family transcriptional regulator [Mobilicoccus caccae]|uniref:HTH gntR-type domain-containing protein n=1 Tax=Mobilicoccus caccae TaxID=1859295 RepID=A0ABQ6ISU7_9MICO|nr:GntR family transcriptional regulator [Mobilicoccus caccae]GMA41019.1 hypothetical protein GCM10025883_30640 [Mobilicoccus caccae]